MESKHRTTIKFLCSYGGKILPRSTDGELRYVGGHTRVLAVDPSISFSELMVKIGELCGSSVKLKCSLPNGDLETLISITSDEDLANIIEEYNRASSSLAHPLKIRAILSPPKSLKKVSPPPSSATSAGHSPTRSANSSTESLPYSMAYRFVRPVAYPVGVRNGSGKACCYTGGQFDGSPRYLYSRPRGNNFCH
ncbi:PB1 domain protein [Senna tora]|uniref:PB1 domain protein n=1 Tax=Senna tora TaxID=362788 RepID=A0A834X4M2_9FABA|nr:PB1 domain protein [Senna tora]